MSNQSGPKTTQVTLTGPVRHRGEPKVKGDQIYVTAPQKAWLAKRELIEDSGKSSSSSAGSTKES